MHLLLLLGLLNGKLVGHKLETNEVRLARAVLALPVSPAEVRVKPALLEARSLAQSTYLRHIAKVHEALATDGKIPISLFDIHRTLEVLVGSEKDPYNPEPRVVLGGADYVARIHRKGGRTLFSSHSKASTADGEEEKLRRMGIDVDSADEAGAPLLFFHMRPKHPLLKKTAIDAAAYKGLDLAFFLRDLRAGRVEGIPRSKADRVVFVAAFDDMGQNLLAAQGLFQRIHAIRVDHTLDPLNVDRLTDKDRLKAAEGAEGFSGPVIAGFELRPRR